MSLPFLAGIYAFALFDYYKEFTTQSLKNVYDINI